MLTENDSRAVISSQACETRLTAIQMPMPERITMLTLVYSTIFVCCSESSTQYCWQPEPYNALAKAGDRGMDQGAGVIEGEQGIVASSQIEPLDANEGVGACSSRVLHHRQLLDILFLAATKYEDTIGGQTANKSSSAYDTVVDGVKSAIS